MKICWENYPAILWWTQMRARVEQWTYWDGPRNDILLWCISWFFLIITQVMLWYTIPVKLILQSFIVFRKFCFLYYSCSIICVCFKGFLWLFSKLLHLLIINIYLSFFNILSFHIWYFNYIPISFDIHSS